MITLPKMPSMSSKRNKPTHDCACGCGMPTKRTWHPGHDGRATGWAMRIERNLITIDDVPENERTGAALMLARRGVTIEVPMTQAERKAARKAQRKAEREAAQATEMVA